VPRLFTKVHLQKRRVLSSEEDFLLRLPSDGLERIEGGYLQLT